MMYNSSAHGIGAHSSDNSGRYVPGIFVDTHAVGSTKKTGYEFTFISRPEYSDYYWITLLTATGVL